MSHTTIGIDQTDEEILNSETSDDALETAAGTGKEKAKAYTLASALICLPFLAQSVVQDTAALR